MQTILDRLTLALLPGLGPRGRIRLLGRAGLAEVFARPDDHPDLLPAPAREALRSGEARRRAGAEMSRAHEEGLRIGGSQVRASHCG